MDREYCIHLLSILSNDAQDKNTYAQANAKHILMSVDTEPEDYPKFNLKLSDQVDAQAYLFLLIGVSLYETDQEQSVFAFEKGAQLIEYNHSDVINRVSTSNYNILVGALAYYCARQYSKSFVLLKKIEGLTKIAQLIKLFLSKDFIPLRQLLNDILLVERKEVDQYEDCQLIIFAESFSLFLRYIETGNNELMSSALGNLRSLQRLAEIDNTPDKWWLYRLMFIVANTVRQNSLWTCLKDLDIHHNLTSQYIRSLVYRPKHPIVELFPSQIASLSKVLSDSGAVVCLPTSSGKTRIAEIGILQTFIKDIRAKVLYIAPFRSLAYEIEDSLAKVFQPLGISITHLYGGTVFSRFDQELIEESQLIIATPEKAKAILRANKSLFDAIKLVILDEGHLLGLEDRYLSNEMFTEELKQTIKNNGGKLILLSAVLPNPESIAEWIAESPSDYVTNSWRASTRRFGLMSFTGNSVDIDWMSEPRGFNRHFVDRVTTKYEAVAKTAKKLSKIGSVMVFVAQARYVLSQGRAIDSVVTEMVDWGDSLEWKEFELACRESKQDELYEFAKKGIMCHSNRLPLEVRRTMESLLRVGKARYVVATNTLAQGVNIGVSVVIIHSVYRSKDNLLPTRDFWNIAGRAGRAFVDSEGIILYLLDQSTQGGRYQKQKKLALEYIHPSGMERVYSGVGLLLQKVFRLANNAGINFESLLEILANDNLSGLLEPQDIIRLDSLDDSFLSLVGDESDLEIEKSLKGMLAYIQADNEDARTIMLEMLKARVRAAKAKCKDSDWQKATALGIPLCDVIFIQNNVEAFRQLAVNYLLSNEGEEDVCCFVKEFEILIQDMPSGKFTYAEIEKGDFIEVQNRWIRGHSFSEFNNGHKYIIEFISFILPWAMNAVARELSGINDELAASVYLNIATCCDIGLPNESAVKVYKSGIQSRASAKNISELLKTDIGEFSVSAIANLIEEERDELIENDKTEVLTKEWLNLFYAKRNNPSDRLPIVSRFDFEADWIESPDKVFCSRKGDDYYLRSLDYRWFRRVYPEKDLPFDKVADIPGLFFVYIGNKQWEMSVENVWVSS